MGTRDVVRVTNADESVVLATAFAIPRYRSTATSEPAFVMQERGTNSPKALQAWYYPGFVDGHQFVYPAAQNLEATSANSAPILAIAAEPAATEPGAPAESSPVMSAEPNITEPTANSTEPTPEPEVMPAGNQSADQNQTASGANAGQTSNELPKTASTTPLIGLIGTLLLAAAVGLKVLASRA